MKEEKEIKFIIKTDIKNIVEAIEKVGFKKQGVFLIEDKYYDKKNYQLIKNKEGYRCRTVENKGNITKELTYKKKVNDIVYEEKMKVEDFFNKINDKETIIIIEKKRLVFKKDENEIVIDVVKNLGNFLEVESKIDNPKTVFIDLEINSEWVERTHLGMTEIWLKNCEEIN